MQIFRFSVAHLLLLTTLAAAALGLFVVLQIPADLWPVIIGGYSLYVATWLGIRGPSVLAGWRQVRRRKAQLAEDRRLLAAEAHAMRESHLARSPRDDAPNAAFDSVK